MFHNILFTLIRLVGGNSKEQDIQGLTLMWAFWTLQTFPTIGLVYELSHPLNKCKLCGLSFQVFVQELRCKTCRRPNWLFFHSLCDNMCPPKLLCSFFESTTMTPRQDAQNNSPSLIKGINTQMQLIFKDQTQHTLGTNKDMLAPILKIHSNIQLSDYQSLSPPKPTLWEFWGFEDMYEWLATWSMLVKSGPWWTAEGLITPTTYGTIHRHLQPKFGKFFKP